MLTRLLSALADTLITLTRHRICCRIPEWTAHVGQRWDTYDVAPWNLGTVLRPDLLLVITHLRAAAGGVFMAVALAAEAP